MEQQSNNIHNIAFIHCPLGEVGKKVNFEPQWGRKFASHDIQMNIPVKTLFKQNPQLAECVKNSVDISLRSSLASDFTTVHPLFQSMLALSELMVLSRLLKMAIVESRMKMEPGGMQRQALRLGEK